MEERIQLTIHIHIHGGNNQIQLNTPRTEPVPPKKISQPLLLFHRIPGLSMLKSLLCKKKDKHPRITG